MQLPIVRSGRKTSKREIVELILGEDERFACCYRSVLFELLAKSDAREEDSRVLSNQIKAQLWINTRTKKNLEIIKSTANQIKMPNKGACDE